MKKTSQQKYYIVGETFNEALQGGTFHNNLKAAQEEVTDDEEKIFQIEFKTVKVFKKIWQLEEVK